MPNATALDQVRALRVAAQRRQPHALAIAAAARRAIFDDIDDYERTFDPQVNEARWFRWLYPVVLEAARAGGGLKAVEPTPLDERAFQLLVRAVREGLGLEIRDITASLRRLLVELIIDRTNEGVPPATMVRDIAALLRLEAPGRAATIGRTEALTFVETGRFTAAQNDSRNLIKEWTAAFINTRDTHEKAHGQRVFLEELFSVGGYGARFPGDPFLPAAERVNCQCAVVYLTATSRTLV